MQSSVEARIRELEEENWRLRERTGAMALEGIIGVSDAMRSICRSIEKVAPTNATVLLLGDSGTGKELLARAVHRLSTRSPPCWWQWRNRRAGAPPRS